MTQRSDQESSLWSQLTVHLRAPSLQEVGIDADTLRWFTEVALAASWREATSDEPRPLVVVLTGPSGGGKSSIFNALLESDSATTSSVSRPTTKGVHCGGNIGSSFEPPAESVLAQATIPPFVRSSAVAPNIVIADGPDHNTTIEANRQIAWRLLCWADTFCYVTTEERYADSSFTEMAAQLSMFTGPVHAIMNKVSNFTEGEAEECLRGLYSAGAINLGTALVIPTAMESTPIHVNALRDRINLTNPVSCGGVDLPRFGRRVQSEIIDSVESWLHSRDCLLERLTRTPDSSDTFTADASVSRLRTIEHENRFWLRYSPRSVVTALGSWLKRPRLLPAKPTPAQPLNTERITKSLSEKTEEILSDYHLRVVELLRSDRVGNLLLESPHWHETETPTNRIENVHQSLINQMSEFANEQITAIHEKRPKHAGVIGRIRTLALDLLIRTTMLALTLCVVPPLLTELLRIIGHPSFTSAFQAELGKWQATFQANVTGLIKQRLDSYIEVLASFGPSSDQLESLKTTLRDLGASGGSVA